MSQLQIGDIVIQKGILYRIKEIDANQGLLEKVKAGKDVRYMWRDLKDYKKLKI